MAGMQEVQDLEQDQSINQVCNFLRETLKVHQSVIEKFRNEKMTLSAVKQASDHDLKELGLTQKGDRLNITRYCETKLSKNEETIEEKKVLLAKILEGNKFKRKMGISDSQPSKKGSGTSGTKKIQLGWLHFQENTKKYLSIRQSKGGGTREVTLSLDATDHQIIETAKEIFFPDGVSPFGNEKNMSFALANYKQELITEVSVNGSKLPFTLQRYIISTKLPKVRLYLATKVTHDTKVKPQGNKYEDDKEDDDDDCYLYHSALDIANDNIEAQYNNQKEDDLDIIFATNQFQQSTETRDNCNQSISDLEAMRTLKAEQDKSFQESLAADQAKEKKKLEQLRVVEEQEKLRDARTARVPGEPEEKSDAVMLQVRHITLGNIKRFFSQSDQMQSVYDWVGSKSLLPMHFELSDFTGHVYSPSQSVRDSEKTTLNMVACENTPSLDDSDIDWFGFGSSSIANDNTLPYDSIPPAGSEPPDQILIDDDLSQVPAETPSRRRDSRWSDPGFRFRQSLIPQVENDSTADVASVASDSGDIHCIQELEYQVDECMKSHSVHRSCIKEDLLRLFADPSIMNQVIDWAIIDEQGRKEKGVGSGVQRDIFSLFWQSMFSSLTVGDVEKVPSIRHDFQKSKWEAIARILVYGFKHCGYVPICLSPVFLTSCIHGEESLTKDDLLTSFSYYITADEREVMQKCLAGELECNDEDVLDLLSSYKCFRQPTKQNIKVLFHELAHQEMIQKPQYIAKAWGPILNVLKRDGNFSDIISIKNLFQAKKPTAKKVVKALCPKINNDSEKQSFEFLKKFIKSLETSSLKVFLRFATGSDVLIHNKIEVTFNCLDGISRRPIAHTCGPLLEVPSTYLSYNELSEEFTSILRDKQSWNFNIV